MRARRSVPAGRRIARSESACAPPSIELTPEHRAVILLREVEGLSYEEISQCHGMRKGHGDEPPPLRPQAAPRSVQDVADAHHAIDARDAGARSGAMTCREVEKLLDLFLDGELEARAMRAVALHVTRCAACEALLQRLRAPPGARVRRHQRRRRRGRLLTASGRASRRAPRPCNVRGAASAGACGRSRAARP